MEEIKRLNVVLKEKMEAEAGKLIPEIERLNNLVNVKVRETEEWH